ncbi:MAG: hypothetical protein QW292_05170 [Candidatus Parvarchaeota archaeon]
MGENDKNKGSRLEALVQFESKLWENEEALRPYLNSHPLLSDFIVRNDEYVKRKYNFSIFNDNLDAMRGLIHVAVLYGYNRPSDKRTEGESYSASFSVVNTAMNTLYQLSLQNYNANKEKFIAWLSRLSDFMDEMKDKEHKVAQFVEEIENMDMKVHASVKKEEFSPRFKPFGQRFYYPGQGLPSPIDESRFDYDERIAREERKISDGTHFIESISFGRGYNYNEV